MASLALHEFHLSRGAQFYSQNGFEAVASYGSPEAEYLALTQAAGLIDLSFRSRFCLLGEAREKFLHGQVTNDILRLKYGEGTYAVLVTAKGKVESDLFIHKLQDELLLDFEPGLAQHVTERLSRYIIAEDVQIVDVAPFYNLLSVQGPKAYELLASTTDFPLPEKRLTFTKAPLPHGDFYIVRNDRFGVTGLDLFVPVDDTPAVSHNLAASVKPVGLKACEVSRIENRIPRFGIDFTIANIAPEAVGDEAISYAKGCYIGQEVIARIRTYGQVAKALRLLHLPEELGKLPEFGEKLFKSGKEVGSITSATFSPKHRAKVAIAYVRKETNAAGNSVHVGAPDGPLAVILS